MEGFNDILEMSKAKMKSDSNAAAWEALHMGASATSKEILSMKQAIKIMSQTNQIMANCKSKLEEKNDDFVKRVSELWEDKNAVEYMKAHKAIFEDMIEQLNINNKVFRDTLAGIADAYAQAGGMNVRMTEQALKLAARIGIEAVKEFFADGNGDDFGFKDPITGPDKVMEAFTSLKTSVDAIMSQTVDEIRGINAFGNAEVRNNLAVSAGEIIKLFRDRIAQDEKVVRQHLEETASKYKNLGSNSATVAKIASN